MFLRVLFFLLAGLGSYAAAFAQENTYAVVVGISDYQALSWRTGDLRFADNDAKEIVRFLRSKPGGSVPASHIRLLTNSQATYANIRQALTLFRQTKTDDRVILYFSGHGMPGSFVPYDVQPGSPQKLLTYQIIKAAFRQSSALTKLCIADACLSGGMSQRQTNIGHSQAQAIASDVSKGSNVAMLLASRSAQNAVETARLAGGAFTYYLLKGLNGHADRNADRLVTIREIHQYISPQVRQATRGRQTPVFYGRFSDDLVLSYL